MLVNPVIEMRDSGKATRNTTATPLKKTQKCKLIKITTVDVIEMTLKIDLRHPVRDSNKFIIQQKWSASIFLANFFVALSQCAHVTFMC